MRASELNNGHVIPRQQMVSRPVLALALAIVATGLGACGGTSSKTIAQRAPQPATASQTTTAPSKTATAPSTTAPKRPAKVKQSHHAVSAPRRTTRPGSAAFYAPAAAGDPGLVPLRCLRSTGLKQARQAVEANVWEGALSKPDLADPKKKVFVDGPYRSAAKASLSANSLNGIEYSASGGRWVVSASPRSRFSMAVRLVAQCLASSGSASAASAGR